MWGWGGGGECRALTMRFIPGSRWPETIWTEPEAAEGMEGRPSVGEGAGSGERALVSKEGRETQTGPNGLRSRVTQQTSRKRNGKRKKGMGMEGWEGEGSKDGGEGRQKEWEGGPGRRLPEFTEKGRDGGREGRKEKLPRKSHSTPRQKCPRDRVGRTYLGTQRVWM